MHEIAEFLQRHAPFDTLSAEQLEAVASACEIQFVPAGTVMLEREGPAPPHVWVIRRGDVALTDGPRVFDLLGEGEMVGHAALLAGTVPGYSAVVHEDALCYRIPDPAIRPILERPAAVRFVVRSLSGRQEARARELASQSPPAVDPARRRVGELLRGPAVIVEPSTSVKDAAARMVEAGSSSVLVALSDRLGILTDRDLRARVVAAGMPATTPVSQLMSVPAHTVAADALGTDVLLEMLDRGIRHMPVLDAHRRGAGGLSPTPLMAGGPPTPLPLPGGPPPP